MLISNVTDVSSGDLCPGGVKFTCFAQLEGVTTLRWFTRSGGQQRQVLADYTHHESNMAFPMTILETPKIVILHSSLNHGTSETIFNSTLEVSLSWFVDMNVHIIECGSYGEFESHGSSYSIRGR